MLSKTTFIVILFSILELYYGQEKYFLTNTEIKKNKKIVAEILH